MQISRGLAVSALCATILVSSAVGVTAKSMVSAASTKHVLVLTDAKGTNLGNEVLNPTWTSIDSHGRLVESDWSHRGTCVIDSSGGLGVHCYPSGYEGAVLPDQREIVPLLSAGSVWWDQPGCRGTMMLYPTSVVYPPNLIGTNTGGVYVEYRYLVGKLRNRALSFGNAKECKNIPARVGNWWSYTFVPFGMTYKYPYAPRKVTYPLNTIAWG